ncbi:MAG: hypothetical protein H8D26_01530 [Methanomicrobia archaeon]|nr:hypothetical protein [Methanomicrobia archaeon]
MTFLKERFLVILGFWICLVVLVCIGILDFLRAIQIQNTQLTAVLIWWLSLFLLGILTFPIIRKVLRNFGDQSYLFSKIFALVLLTYLTWILSHLFSYSIATITAALAILLFCSILVQRKYALRLKIRSVVEGELIFLSIFLFFLLIRAYRPEIGGLDVGMVGEKWMDFAFLNAVGRSDYFPPIDPWFSSRVIDCYYYFGYLATSILVKITTIKASIAYNLAVATYAALLGSAVFGIAANICRKKSCGWIAVLFVLFLGNLGILAPLWIEMSKGINFFQVLTTPNFSYFWIPSRVVPDGITEFPFFTYILGDLHPHLVAMPFQMLVLALLLELFCEKNFVENRFMLMFLPLCLGFLIPLNSWDYFTYAMLLLGIIAVKVRGMGIRRSSILSFGLILASLVLYLPFFLEFRPKAIEGIELVTGGRTPVYSLVAMFGIFLLLLFSWLLFSIKNFFAKNFFFKERFYFVHLLILFGVAAILIPEVVYFKSGFYSSAVDRGNTIFKFYLQAWLLLGIASTFIVCQLKEKIERKSLKTVFFVMFTVLLIISALYPVLAVNSWTGGFGLEPTLDGIGYMKERDDYQGEYQAIEWLNENVENAIILEAVEDEERRTDYCRPGRISASTGLQTVIGWPWHEFLWRRDEEVWRRADDVKEIYSTDNVSLALSLLNKYNVSYVYVGRQERVLYEAEGLAKFESNYFEEVFCKEGVEIYRVEKVTFP